MAAVRLECRLEPPPYPTVPDSKDEAWGVFRLVLDSVRGPVLLFEWQWDLLAIADWFSEHRDALCTARLPTGSATTEERPGSLAQQLRWLSEQSFTDDPHAPVSPAEARHFEQLFQYRRSHSLRFALRGAPVREVIIGCSSRGGEISVDDRDGSWAYPLDLGEFLHQAATEFLRVVDALTADNHPGAPRLQAAVGALRSVTRSCCT